MNLLIFASLVCSVLGAPVRFGVEPTYGRIGRLVRIRNMGDLKRDRRYNTRQNGPQSYAGGFASEGNRFSSGSFVSGTNKCPRGQVMRSDGTCVRAVITRNIYVYSAPDIIMPEPEPMNIPKPRINYNVVFVRTPEIQTKSEPIVIPPPQQKTLVFVLTKAGESKQRIIEVPAGPDEEPEVFYINYNDGDNMKLPGGITLQEALASQDAREGQRVEDDNMNEIVGELDPNKLYGRDGAQETAEPESDTSAKRATIIKEVESLYGN